MTKEEVIQLYDRYIELKNKNSWSAHSRDVAVEKVKINVTLNLLDIEEIGVVAEKLLSDNNLSFLSKKQLIDISDDENFRNKVQPILRNL